MFLRNTLNSYHIYYLRVSSKRVGAKRLQFVLAMCPSSHVSHVIIPTVPPAGQLGLEINWYKCQISTSVFLRNTLNSYHIYYLRVWCKKVGDEKIVSRQQQVKDGTPLFVLLLYSYIHFQLFWEGTPSGRDNSLAGSRCSERSDPCRQILRSRA